MITNSGIFFQIGCPPWNRYNKEKWRGKERERKGRWVWEENGGVIAFNVSFLGQQIYCYNTFKL